MLFGQPLFCFSRWQQVVFGLNALILGLVTPHGLVGQNIKMAAESMSPDARSIKPVSPMSIEKSLLPTFHDLEHRINYFKLID